MGVTPKNMGFLLGVMRMLWNYIPVMIAHPCEYIKNCQIVHFKIVIIYCVWIISQYIFFQNRKG